MSEASSKKAEIFKATLSLPAEAFKYAGLINGGGAVALLAYAGAVSKAGNVVVPAVTPAIVAFLVGLGLCGLGLMATFWMLMFLLGDMLGTDDEKMVMASIMISGILYLGGLAAFALGCILGIRAF